WLKNRSASSICGFWKHAKTYSVFSSSVSRQRKTVPVHKNAFRHGQFTIRIFPERTDTPMALSLAYKRPSLTGSTQVPGDTSISHRAIMFGSMASGTTTVKGFLMGDDCLSTISCFQKLGVKIDISDEV